MKNYGTLVIILINILVFVVLNLMSGFQEVMLLSADVGAIVEQPWSLVTVFFSHVLFFHLVLNMILLFFFGIELEKITNVKWLVSIYILAGFVGSLAIVPVAMFVGNEDLIAGASAAVFAIVVAFAVMRPDALVLKSKAKWWALALLVFNVLTLVFNSQMADGAVAHLAGILVGVCFGLWLRNRESKRSLSID